MRSALPAVARFVVVRTEHRLRAQSCLRNHRLFSTASRTRFAVISLAALSSSSRLCWGALLVIQNCLQGGFVHYKPRTQFSGRAATSLFADAMVASCPRCCYLPLETVVELLRYVQSLLDHPVKQVCEVMLLEEQRGTKPLRIFLNVLADPFTGSLGERSNQRKRSLGENPDVRFAGREFH